MSKHERIISIFGTFMTKFHELPEQPTYFPFVPDHDSLRLTLASNLISIRQISFWFIWLCRILSTSLEELSSSSSCCDSESSLGSPSLCSFCLQMPPSKCLLRLSDLENWRKQVWHWYDPPVMSVVCKMNEIQWWCRLHNKRKKLLGCFHTFFLVSVRYPLFHCWMFLRRTLGFTKFCWTKFYATMLTVFSWYVFSEFANQCSTQVFSWGSVFVHN